MKPTAIVLGGTVPHIQLIQKLKMRGYYVVLADYFDDPPARGVADEHIKVSTLDKEAVLCLAKERDATLVISACVDQANVTCCFVAEKMGLPRPYDYETALNVTDKTRMKEILLRNNIPTSRYLRAATIDEIQTCNLRYPLVVKPADSNSSNGVKIVRDDKQLRFFFLVAQSMSRSKTVIVEEFSEGIEISAYCVIVKGRARLLMTQERISIAGNDRESVKCFAAFAPARISPEIEGKAENVATRIANAFNLDNTPLFFQAIVSGQNINVIEFAPRIGGGMSFRTIFEGTGFDIISAAIDSFLCRPIDVSIAHRMCKCFALNQLYGKSGRYHHCKGCENLISRRIVDNISFYKVPLTFIDGSRASSGRIGVLAFSGQDEGEIKEKILIAMESVDCIDTDGASMLRRELNFGKVWDLTKSRSMLSDSDFIGK